MTPARPPRLAVLLGFATIYLVWGSTYLAIRVAVGTLPPFLLIGSRFLVAGTALYAWLRWRGVATAGLWNRDNLVVGLCLVGGNALVAWAEQRVPSNLSALTIGAAPLFMVGFTWLMPGGARPNRTVGVGVLLGLTGLGVLFGPGAFPPGERPPAIRIAALFISCAAWCLGSVYSKHRGQSSSAPLSSAAGQMLIGGAGMAITGLLAGETRGLHGSAVTSASVLAFLYLTVVGSLLAFPTYIWLLRHSSPVRVSTYAYVNPVVALILGWLLLHETLPARALAAVPILLGGVVLIISATDRTKASAPAQAGTGVSGVSGGRRVVQRAAAS